ncbi:YkgJ family cysteine cluster protein [uncultured Shewanella sp.]|uniref:YkgJ family cysteine cluster protein n=1 Tax=uncultured Shewanella sp. TaxID=173975 RepID=UPI00260AC004|nr:YkgJ family cysteine cluster protein [uncultured Shewanella sp.]
MNNEQEFLSGIADAEESEVQVRIAESADASTLCGVVENAGDFAKNMRDKVVDPRTPSIACRTKCDHCCYQSVSITAPEALRIADYLTQRKSKLVQRFIYKLNTLNSKIEEKTPEQRGTLNLPCAFLEKGKCQIYKVRPLLCQKHTSLNLKECIAAKPKGFPPGSITEEKAQHVTYTAVLSGYRSGLQKSLPTSFHGNYELTKAILVALETEDAATLWISGQDVFKGCEIKLA